MNRQRYWQGRYTPINKDKIIGNPDRITYRSSWERALMQKFDTSPNILKWGSEVEGMHIWYESPLDGQKHRYFMDFIVISCDESGNIQTTMIEVKPYKECFEPVRKQGKKKIQFINEVKTYVVNIAKWRAAYNIALKKGWKFLIITEKKTFRHDEIGVSPDSEV